MAKHFDEEAEGLVVPDELQEFYSTLNQANYGHHFEPECLSVVMDFFILITLQVYLNGVEYGLRAIHVVVGIIEVTSNAREANLSILQGQEKELRCAAKYVKTNL